MQRLTVQLGPRTYSILVGGGLLSQVGVELARLGLGKQIAVVTQPPVAARYGTALRESLVAAGFTPHFAEVPDGEEAKSITQTQTLWDAFCGAGLDRGSAVVALGGGVVGDLAGFAASTFMRGLPFVQVPTTLLAQVDASVGGKVAINHPRAKNLIGAFHQPRLVVSDPDVLRTLPRREFVSGLAEVIKCGVALDAELFRYLEGNLSTLLALDSETLTHVIGWAVRLKAEIVEKDEEETTGLRAILNFGHTLGHAIETVAGYGRYLHGEAVAVGMAGAAWLSRRLTGLDEQAAERLGALLRVAELPTSLPRADVEALLGTMALDKKVRSGGLTFVLLEAPGRARIVRGIPPALVREMFHELNEASEPAGASR